MPHLPVAARVPLPEPLSFVHTCFRHDGRRGVAVGERSGRVWLLEVDPARRTCALQALPVTVPRRPDRDEWMVEDLSGSHALDRLLLWTDQPRVYDIPSGQVAAELGRIPGRALCLSPDGRWVVCLDEGGGATMHLDEAAPGWRETLTFHAMENDDGAAEALYLDHVDRVVAHPCDDADAGEGQFWIAAGCYGFVATHRVDALHGLGELRRVPGRSRGAGDLVYDPTELLRPFGHRHVFVWHGYGTGLSALDPATGELHHCWIRGRGRQPYGFFSGVVPCGQAPLAWGSSRDGAFLWRVGEPPRMVPDAPGLALAPYPDALLCLSPDGGELLWCDLPLSA